MDAVRESNQRLVAVMRHTWHFRMLPKISNWDNIMPATYESVGKWKWEDTTGNEMLWRNADTLKRLHLKWLCYIKYYLRTHSVIQEGIWRNITMENTEDQNAVKPRSTQPSVWLQYFTSWIGSTSIYRPVTKSSLLAVLRSKPFTGRVQMITRAWTVVTLIFH